MSVKYVFSPLDDQPAVDLYWYHAKQGPPILKRHGLSHEGHNTLFVGTEGMLLCGFGRHTLYPEEKFADVKPPSKSIPDSPGFHKEWIQACKGGPAASCEFGYSGPLSETVILGNVAYRAEGTFDWDAREFQLQGNERAEELLRPTFRQGWDSPIT